MDKIAIGIDLDTFYSTVAVFQQDKVEIIPNEEGNQLTASYVAFNDRERFIGNAAKNQILTNLSNTIFDIQRLIGREFNDPTVQRDMKHWPFKVINHNQKLKIEVEYKSQTEILTPVEILSMILTKLKENSENYLGKNVSTAVIAVPVYFNDSQRQQIKDAATIANLNVLRIINKSTAAALAYNIENRMKSQVNILVFHLGGTTLNITVLTVQDEIFDVISTAGETHLGGQDFNYRMVQYFIQEFRRKHKKDLSNNQRALRRLYNACESAKTTLLSSLEAKIEIDLLHEGINFTSKITRKQFEELHDDLFHSMIQTVVRALNDANMNKSHIHQVLLVGGSSSIPKVQKILQEFFNKKQLIKSLNPNEAVACGAAIQAAILTDNKSNEIQNLILLDVTSSTLGIETSDGVMTTMIQRHTTMPAERTQIFEISLSSQSDKIVAELSLNNTKTQPSITCNKKFDIEIKVFEGESNMTRENSFLGSFIFSDIPLIPSKIPKIQITFDIDVNGVLSVLAMDINSEKGKLITIINERVRLSKDEIKQMIINAEKYKKDDDIERKRIEAKNSLESYCLSIKTRINGEILIDNNDRKEIIDVIEKTMKWLERNQLAEEEEFQYELKEIEKISSSIIFKLDHEKIFN